MITRIDPELARLFDENPGVEVEAIVFSADGLDDLLAQLPPDVRVVYQYRLNPSVCVAATGSSLRRLADLPVVKSIEPVRSVSAF